MDTYKLTGQRGIDDLRTEYAFHGSSQGDEIRLPNAFSTKVK